MENLKKPIWLIVANVLPQLLVFLLFYEAYGVINPLLKEEGKQAWLYFAIGYGAINVGWLGYSIYLMSLGQLLHKATAWLLLVVNIACISVYFSFIDVLLPSNIPNWMFTSSDLEIYPYSFLIPGCLYGLILLVIDWTPDDDDASPYFNVLPIILIPLSVLLGSYILSNLIDYDYGNVTFKYIPIFLFISFTCLFVFFVIRFIYMLAKKRKGNSKIGIAVAILFTLVFPVAGLVLNKKMEFSGDGGMFGDFSHPLYFVFAIANGLLLSIPAPENVSLRWLVFIGKSLLFAYICYFFAVFAPYLPLSILAIILVGLGFLMLAPVIVFIYQLASLKKDYDFLRYHASGFTIGLVFLVSFAVLPTAITLNYKADRAELDKALNFIYDRSYDDNNSYEFSEDRITRLLQHIRNSKSRTGTHTPFLDSYYNWLVLDNLMLSDKKIDDISNILTGIPEIKKQGFSFRRWRIQPRNNAKVDSLYVETEYQEDGYWKSMLHMKVSRVEETPDTNSNNRFFRPEPAEFRCFIETPDDCHISDYYLEIEGRREYGILAEKKSAKWIYNNIVTIERRDPGILYSTTPNRYILKVFPVDSAQRVTGIEFLHKEPIHIALDTLDILLGDANKLMYPSPLNSSPIEIPEQAKEPIEVLGGKALYLPSGNEGMSVIRRTPRYHIIVDRSNSYGVISDAGAVDLVQKVMDKLNLGKENSTVWAANYNYEQVPLSDMANGFKAMPKKGGFFPEYLMRKIIHDNYLSHSTECPVFILVSHHEKSAIFMKSLDELGFAYPDMDHFFTADAAGEVFKHIISMGAMDTIVTDQDLVPDSLYSYLWKDKQWLFPIKDGPKLISDGVPDDEIFGKADEWEKALFIKAMVRNYILNPNEESAWQEIIFRSMQTGVLSPFTTYISLENEAQKNALLHKQKQVLSGDKNFDIEEVENMSEPSLWWYIGALLLLLLLSRRGRKLLLRRD